MEENVNSQLREKQGEKMLRMQRNDEAVFDELFSFACPKFITPSPPNYDELVNYNQVFSCFLCVTVGVMGSVGAYYCTLIQKWIL